MNIWIDRGIANKKGNEKTLYKIRVENQNIHLLLQDCSDKIKRNKVSTLKQKQENISALSGPLGSHGTRNIRIILHKN